MKLQPGRATLPILLAGLVAFCTAGNSAAQPNLLMGPTALEFSALQAGSQPAPQTVFVASSGASLSYAAKGGYSSIATDWLSVSPASGATPATLTVTIDTTNLAKGVYFGYVEIASGTTPPDILPVTLRIGDPATARPLHLTKGMQVLAKADRSQLAQDDTALVAEPAELTFDLQSGSAGQSIPPVQTVKIRSSTGAILNYTASADFGSWLAVGPRAGSTADTASGVTTSGSDTIAVAINPANLAEGTHAGFISVTAPGATAPLTIPITFTTAATGGTRAAITADQTSITLQGPVTGPAQTTQIHLTGSPNESYSIGVSPSLSWLSVSPSSGSTPATITVTADPSVLSGAGSNSGQIFISAASGNQIIPVTYVATGTGGAITITPSPTTLTFTPTSGTTSQTVQLTSATPTTFSASPNAQWLTVTPSSGTTPATLTFTVDPTKVVAGTLYQSSATINGVGTSVNVQVNYTAPSGATNSLTVAPTSLTFTTASSQTVQLTSTTPTSFNASPNASWITVTPTSGTTPSGLSISVSATTLAAGTPYQGSVTVTGGGAGINIPVTFNTPGAAATPITATPTSVSFTQTLGGTVPASQTVQLTSSTATSFTAVSTSTWLTVMSSSTTTPATLTLSVNPAGLAAGTYMDSVTITGGPSNLTIPVTLTITSNAPNAITAAPPLATFSQALGAAAPASQTIQLSSPTATNFTAVSTSTWLSVTPTSGTTPATLTLSVNPSGLTAGTYNGSVTVSGGASNVTIPVTYTITSNAPNAITPLPTSLTFSQTLNGTAAASQTVQLSSTTPTSFSAVPTTTWLTVTPSSGTTPATLTVAVSATGLSAGTYTGAVTVTGGASNVTIPVTFTISGSASIAASPTSVTFVQTLGGSSPASQTVQLTGGTGSSFTAASTTTWLTVSPTSGTTPSTLTLSVSASGFAVGTYQGSVTVTGGDTPLTIPVTLVVVGTSSSTIVASPVALAFTHTAGQNSFGIQSVQLTSATATGFAASSNVSWLTVSPVSGTTPATLTLSVDASGLAAGTYTGTITVTGGVAPVSIPVMLTVTVASNGINASSSSATFTQIAGGPAPVTQTITLSSPSPTNFTLSNTTTWLTVTPTSGTSPATLTLTANPAGLAIGSYQDTITISGGAAPVTIPVTFTITGDTFAPSPSSLSFKQTVGGSAPSSQTLQLSSSTPRNYIASSTASWLSVSPSIGMTPAMLSVTANGAGMAAGTYQTTISVSGAGSPVTIPVTLTISNATGATLNPSTLAFSYTAGGTPPASQTVSVSSPGSDFAFTASATAGNNGAWLSVTPTSGATPTSLTVTATPTGLASGKYAGIVTITPNDTSIPSQTIPVTLTVGGTSTSLLFVRSILNAASLLPGPIAPGEIITITGSGLGPTVGVGPNVLASGAVDTTLSGTRLLFDGIAAPLLYVRADQINAIVPYNVYGRIGTNMQVEISGVASDPIGLRVNNTAPAIFTIDGSGHGQGAVINQDGTINSPSSPAPRGTIVAIYGTGEGQTNPPGQDGRIITTDVRSPIAPVTASIAGVSAPVRYMGSAPGSVAGLFQLNVLVPNSLAAGPQAAVGIQIGDAVTQSVVTIAIK